MSNQERNSHDCLREKLNNTQKSKALSQTKDLEVKFSANDHGLNKNHTVKHGESQKVTKGKNAKKKEMNRNLRLEMPGTSAPTPLQTPPNARPQNGFISVQHLYLHQVGPMYPPSKNYLENFRPCLPQYQYMQSSFVNVIQTQTGPVLTPGSLPNSPLSHMNCTLQAWSTPNSPVTTNQGSACYMQNVMQHPLQNQSYVRHNNIQHTRVPMNVEKKKKSKKNDDKCFEPYFSVEMVEAGLNENTLIEGIVRINPKHFQHAYISNNDRSEQDIFIDGIKNRNRALEGDIVVVQLIQQSEDKESENSNSEAVEENKQKRGKVIFIKEKVHPRTCIGHLKLMPDKNRMKALFVPRDYRIPRLNIPFTSWPDNFYNDAKMYESTLFLAKIENWDDIRYALGKIVCNIGQSGNMLTESKAILAQSDLDVTPFGSEVRHLYPRLDYVIPEGEIQKREDCRKLCIFSIDPASCRDIDDAVSCRKLENGNYEVGVHISDVTHFLMENTILDERVAEKATTIYLVEKAYHMLPDDLCMLCSLFPGVDKLAFSVFWEITHDAEVLNHRFSKTIIHSCCQLTYDHVQDVLENKKNAKAAFPEFYNGFQYEEVYETIKILGKLSATFRNGRFESGALRIDQPKVSFHLNPLSGLPDAIWIYESKESHQLIEEFMLLANMTVAKRIYEDHPNLAFLRCHPPPSRFMLQQLAKTLKPMGIDLDVTSSGNLYKSLMKYVGPDNTDKGKALVLNMLCAKPMTRAKYFCAAGYHDDEFRHYALNIPLYTHFTSPIRRYADIMVHR